MTPDQSLPFKIGDLAESRSFQGGYRGAWFRCKDIRRKDGHIIYALEYYDYPEEKIKWTRIYQKPYRSSCQKEVKRELMVRPHFPPIYRESELPDVSAISEVAVVVDGVWRVGDLVDWSYEGCFWSGTITEVKGDDEVKIKLPEPPIGEGKFYEARCQDLRPSLDWSPEIGWTVPKSLESQNALVCAHLIRTTKPGSLTRSLAEAAEEDMLNIRATPNSLLEFNESTSSHNSASSMPLLSRSMHSKNLVAENKESEKEMLQTNNKRMDLDTGGSTVGRPTCSDGVSSTYVRDVPDEAPGAGSAQEQYDGDRPAKKVRVNESVSLNSTASDSIESSIMDLEELVNKVKWLRQYLKSGVPSESEGPTWKFLEHPKVRFPK